MQQTGCPLLGASSLASGPPWRSGCSALRGQAVMSELRGGSGRPQWPDHHPRENDGWTLGLERMMDEPVGSAIPVCRRRATCRSCGGGWGRPATLWNGQRARSCARRDSRRPFSRRCGPGGAIGRRGRSRDGRVAPADRPSRSGASARDRHRPHPSRLGGGPRQDAPATAPATRRSSPIR